MGQACCRPKAVEPADGAPACAKAQVSPPVGPVGDKQALHGLVSKSVRDIKGLIGGLAEDEDGQLAPETTTLATCAAADGKSAARDDGEGGAPLPAHLSTQAILDQWESDQVATLRSLDAVLAALEAAAETAESRAARSARLRASTSESEARTAVRVDTAAPPLHPMPITQDAKSSIARATSGIFRDAHAPHGAADAALVAAAREAAAAHRPLTAREALLELCEAQGLTLDQLADRSELLGLDVGAVLAEAAEVDTVLAGLEDESGLSVVRDDELRLLYCHQRGTTIHSVKLHTVFPHPLAHLLAMAHEIDLVKTWNRFCLDSIKLAEPSVWELYCYMAQWMPRPFRHLQSLMHARGVDLGDQQRSLLVLLGDGDPEALPPGAAAVPQQWGERRRWNLLPGSCILLCPLPPSEDGRPRTEAAMLVHADPHIPFVPGWLVNFVLGFVAPYVYAQLCKVLDTNFADPSGEYNRRIAAKPELYGLLKSRLEDFKDEQSFETQVATLC